MIAGNTETECDVLRLNPTERALVRHGWYRIIYEETECWTDGKMCVRYGESALLIARDRARENMLLDSSLKAVMSITLYVKPTNLRTL